MFDGSDPFSDALGWSEAFLGLIVSTERFCNISESSEAFYDVLSIL